MSDGDTAPVEDLIDLLDLEKIEVNHYRGSPSREDRVRTFGGEVAAQALVAATRTVDEDRPVHSLHAYFLRAGDPAAPTLYEVDRIRDGRSFTTRRVVAWQHGRAIFNLQASFQRSEPGFDYQVEMPADLPDPETLPTQTERLAHLRDQLPEFFFRPRPIDVRYGAETGDSARRVWFRASGRLPDDPNMHVCVLTYASDMTLLDTTTQPHGISSTTGEVQMASLDHAMWFHRPFRADEWLLYDQTTPSSSGARGLAMGNVFTADGVLVANVVQEGLIRPIRQV